MARPSRLRGTNYTGFGAYFVTSCTRDRINAFCDHDFCPECVVELTATSRRHGFAVPAYCFMPDQVHLLLAGEYEDASLPVFVAMWKQRIGFAWHRRRQAALWQKGYWERVLRSEDSMLSIARYIVENPVRAGLVADVRHYPWVGSDRYGLEDILAACQLDVTTKWHR